MSLLSTVLMAPFTASGLVAEGMVTGAVGRRVESAERVDTAAMPVRVQQSQSHERIDSNWLWTLSRLYLRLRYGYGAG